MIGAEFLGMIMLIVYVGAVAVLFLFVVMMLNITEQESKRISRKESKGGTENGVGEGCGSCREQPVLLLRAVGANDRGVVDGRY